jgi:hypothetical protein
MNAKLCKVIRKEARLMTVGYPECEYQPQKVYIGDKFQWTQTVKLSPYCTRYQYQKAKKIVKYHRRFGSV